MPQLYDQIYVEVDGALEAEEASVDIEWVGDDAVVITVVKGFAGVTPNAKHMEIMMNLVYPQGGLAEDYITDMLTKSPHNVRLQTGSGQSLISAGYFVAPIKISAGVGKTTDVSVKFVGTPAAFA